MERISQQIVQRLPWALNLVAKISLGTVIAYPSLLFVGPIIAASLVRVAYIVHGSRPGGEPFVGDNGDDFYSEEDKAEMKRRGVDPNLPLLKKVGMESISYSSGLPAVLLQIADQGVGKGVGRHSNFSYRLVERGQNTAIFVYVMVYGTNTEKKAFRNFVTMAHKHVNDKKTKNTYDALDPHLQLWVAATMYKTMIEAYEMVFPKFSDEDAEKVYQEFSVFGTSLQVPMKLWPENRAAFNKYWDDYVEHLDIPEEGYKVSQDLFYPKYGRVPASLVPILWFTRPLNIAMAAEGLPEHIRTGFGIKSTWETKTIVWLLNTFHKLTYRLYPKWVRTWQKDYYLWMMRERFAKKGMTRNGKTISFQVLDA